jgi:hypothetical protein
LTGLSTETGFYLHATSLRKLVFEPHVAVEAFKFILRHAPTLTRLVLVLCELPHEDQGDEISDVENPAHHGWARVWDLFAAELLVLIALSVDQHCHGTNAWGFASSEPIYVGSGTKVSYTAFDVGTQRNAADAAALQQFYAKVAARSEHTRVM